MIHFSIIINNKIYKYNYNNKFSLDMLILILLNIVINIRLFFNYIEYYKLFIKN